MENELLTPPLALASMIELAADAAPGRDTTSATLIRRTLAGRATRTVDKAMEVASRLLAIDG